MPALAAERLAEALRALDPVSRSLLDLSLRRGIPDDEIAKIVGTEPDLLAARREDVLAELAEALELEGSPADLARLRALLKETDWRSTRREVQPSGPPGEAERMGEPERRKPTSDHAIGPGESPARGRWALLGAVVLSFALAARRRRGG